MRKVSSGARQKRGWLDKTVGRPISLRLRGIYISSLGERSTNIAGVSCTSVALTGFLCTDFTAVDSVFIHTVVVGGMHAPVPAGICCLQLLSPLCFPRLPIPSNHSLRRLTFSPSHPPISPSSRPFYYNQECTTRCPVQATYSVYRGMVSGKREGRGRSEAKTVC